MRVSSVADPSEALACRFLDYFKFWSIFLEQKKKSVNFEQISSNAFNLKTSGNCQLLNFPLLWLRVSNSLRQVLWSQRSPSPTSPCRSSSSTAACLWRRRWGRSLAPLFFFFLFYFCWQVPVCVHRSWRQRCFTCASTSSCSRSRWSSSRSPSGCCSGCSRRRPSTAGCSEGRSRLNGALHLGPEGLPVRPQRPPFTVATGGTLCACCWTNRFL